VKEGPAGRSFVWVELLGSSFVEPRPVQKDVSNITSQIYHRFAQTELFGFIRTWVAFSARVGKK